MTFLTKQEILDIVVPHLLTQGVKSMDIVQGMCMYRGPQGTKCAVGILIADEVYTDKIETVTASVLFSRYRSILKASRIDPDSIDIELLLAELQNIHDNEPCDNWCDSLKELAVLNDLVFNMKG